VSSIEPNQDGGRIDACQEVYGKLVVAGSGGTELLQFAEEILNEMARREDDSVMGARVLAPPFAAAIDAPMSAWRKTSRR
jgi:hypothetical protein